MSDKVILVVIDGLGLPTALEHCGYLESLVAGGKARRWEMQAVLPTLSAPIYETLHTGLAPHEHGITSNDNLRQSNCEHVFAIARRHDRRTAAAAHCYFSSIYNAHPYQPLRDQECNDPQRAIQHGRFYSERGYTKFNSCLISDHDLMNQASILVDRYQPDYLLIHSSTCDAIGHKYGGGSPEYCMQAWAVDDQLAQHVPAWLAAGYRVLVTADHGFTAFGHHGGTTDDVRRVPFYDIGHPQPGVASDIASQLAVAPTILALLGLPIPPGMGTGPLSPARAPSAAEVGSDA